MLGLCIPKAEKAGIIDHIILRPVHTNARLGVEPDVVRRGKCEIQGADILRISDLGKPYGIARLLNGNQAVVSITDHLQSNKPLMDEELVCFHLFRRFLADVFQPCIFPVERVLLQQCLRICGVE